LRRGLAALLVVLTLVGASTAEALAAPGENGQTTAVAQTASGQYIADFALQFVGSPYVWAGNTPAGFDCSGFTQYVILNTVGIDIGHGTAGQTGYGAFVTWDGWQPGDLVFFANTYSAGISHAGVYIGDGQFVHAENEATGVTISSLYSDYYGAHYSGAYRIG
nr:C40 family peptidase [Chloroflexia bacterium]